MYTSTVPSTRRAATAYVNECDYEESESGYRMYIWRDSTYEPRKQSEVSTTGDVAKLESRPCRHGTGYAIPFALRKREPTDGAVLAVGVRPLRDISNYGLERNFRV